MKAAEQVRELSAGGDGADVEAGRIDPAPFISGQIGLDGVIDKGFDTLISHDETAMKILVSPSGEGL